MKILIFNICIFLVLFSIKSFAQLIEIGNIEFTESDNIHFVTKKISNDLPYFQGFEDSVFPPAGWTISGAKPWLRGLEEYDGRYCAKVNYTPAGTAILTSPYFNIPSGCKISFWWKDDDITSSSTGNKVSGHDTTFFEISTSHGQSWTVLGYLSFSEPMLDYMVYSHYLGDIAGDSILFRWRDWTDGSFSAWGIGLDNISINPANLTWPFGLLNIDSFNFGNVGMEYSVSSGNNFTLYNEGHINLNIDSVYGLENTEFSMDVNLIGQSIAVMQQIHFGFSYFPLDEGADTAICYIQTNGGTFLISLFGNGIKLPPFYSENFENTAIFPPVGWKTIDGDDDGHCWRSTVDFPHSGSNCATSESYLETGEILFPDNYLITPKITVDESNCILSWWVSAGDSVYSFDHYGVYISTSGSTISDFNTLLYEETLTSGVWARHVLDLRNYIGEKIFLAFRHCESSDNFSVRLDDISLNPFFENVVEFHITSNGQEVYDAVVTFNGITNSPGEYMFTNNVPGVYPFTITKPGCASYSGMATVTPTGASVSVNLEPLTYTVTFIVKIGSNIYPEAIITFNNISNGPGNYVFNNVLPGTYSYSVIIPGYTQVTGAVSVVSSNVTVLVGVPGYYSVTFRPFCNGMPVENAVITLGEWTNMAGNYVFDSIFQGVYPYWIQKSGFENSSGFVNVLSDNQIVEVQMTPVYYNVLLNLNLTAHSGFNPSCDQVYVSGSFNNWAIAGTDTVYELTCADSNMFYFKLLHLSTGRYSYKYYINSGMEGGETGQHEISVFSDTVLNDIFLTSIFFKDHSGIEIFPNPFENVLIINNTEDFSKVVVLDCSGKEVFCQRNFSNRSIEIPTVDFPSGFYLVKLENESGFPKIFKAIKH